MERKISILLSTLFLMTLFTMQVLAGTSTIEPGIYYQTSMTQSGTYLETTQYGEDKGNYLSISRDLTNKTTFEWYHTSYSGYAYRVMSGTIIRNADGSYTIINDINDPNNDVVESRIESITPISDSEILVYSWGEGDGRWDDYYTMKLVSSVNDSNSLTKQSVYGTYYNPELGEYIDITMIDASTISVEYYGYTLSGERSPGRYTDYAMIGENTWTSIAEDYGKYSIESGAHTITFDGNNTITGKANGYDPVYYYRT